MADMTERQQRQQRELIVHSAGLVLWERIKLLPKSKTQIVQLRHKGCCAGVSCVFRPAKRTRTLPQLTSTHDSHWCECGTMCVFPAATLSAHVATPHTGTLTPPHSPTLRNPICRLYSRNRSLPPFLSPSLLLFLSLPLHSPARQPLSCHVAGAPDAAPAPGVGAEAEEVGVVVEEGVVKAFPSMSVESTQAQGMWGCGVCVACERVRVRVRVCIFALSWRVVDCLRLCAHLICFFLLSKAGGYS